MNNLITRGLSKVRNTLVTWGLLGVSTGVAQQHPGHTDFYDEYLRRDEEGSVSMVGTKMSPEEMGTVVIQGIKVIDVNKEVGILGIRILDDLSERSIQGTKALHESRQLSVIGYREFPNEGRQGIHGRRVLQEAYEVKGIKGAKELNEHKEVPVTGKRDMLSILEALDLLD